MEESDDDAPLAVMTTKVPMPGAHAAAVGATSTRSPRRASAKFYKEESDDDFDIPPGTNMASQDEEGADSSSDSSDDEPLVKKKKAAPRRASNGTNGKATKGKATKRKKSEDTSEEDDSTEMEKPAKKAKQPAKKRVKKEVKEEASSDDEPLSKASPTKKEAKSKKVKKEEAEEDVFKWWEQEAPDDIEGDGSKKWDTLQHGGVLFPPPYEPLPSSVKILYDGQPVDLPPEPEEVATFFATMLDTDHAQNDVFQKNFFNDWLAVLKEHPPVCIYSAP